MTPAGPGTWRKLYEVFEAIEGAVDVPPVGPIPPDQGIPQFPGTSLKIGSTGSNVALMQDYLNGIGKVYTSIPTLVVDGSFGSSTQAAVKEFQRLFGLTVDGIIGQITWYRIIEVFNSLTSGQVPEFPGTPLRIGSRGNDVLIMQNYLSAISKTFPVVPGLNADGIFGTATRASVIAFQSLFGLTPDGIIGQYTWDKIVYVYNSLPNIYTPQYPGTALRVGSQGNNVLIMQKYLNIISGQYSSIPSLTADGIFGPKMQSSVIAFQRKFGLVDDGIIGRNTWNYIVSVHNMIIMNASRAITYFTESSKSKEPTSTCKGSNLDKYALLLAISMFRRR